MIRIKKTGATMACLGTITVAADDLALSDALSDLPDAQARLEETVGTPQGTAASLWITGPSEQAVRTALEASDSVTHVEQLVDGDGEWLYDVEFDADMTVLRRLVFFHDGTILNGSIEETTWTFDLRFPTRDAFSAVVDDLGDQEFDVRVDQIRTLDRESLTRAAESLTDAQYELLEAAVERGYFEIPRESSLEDLAEEFDVSQQAASEMMRRAQETLAAAAVEETDGKVAREV